MSEGDEYCGDLGGHEPWPRMEVWAMCPHQIRGWILANIEGHTGGEIIVDISLSTLLSAEMKLLKYLKSFISSSTFPLRVALCCMSSIS